MPSPRPSGWFDPWVLHKLLGQARQTPQLLPRLLFPRLKAIPFLSALHCFEMCATATRKLSSGWWGMVSRTSARERGLPSWEKRTLEIWIFCNFDLACREKWERPGLLFLRTQWKKVDYRFIHGVHEVIHNRSFWWSKCRMLWINPFFLSFLFGNPQYGSSGAGRGLWHIFNVHKCTLPSTEGFGRKQGVFPPRSFVCMRYCESCDNFCIVRRNYPLAIYSSQCFSSSSMYYFTSSLPPKVFSAGREI